MGPAFFGLGAVSSIDKTALANNLRRDLSASCFQDIRLTFFFFSFFSQRIEPAAAAASMAEGKGGGGAFLYSTNLISFRPHQPPNPRTPKFIKLQRKKKWRGGATEKKTESSQLLFRDLTFFYPLLPPFPCWCRPARRPTGHSTDRTSGAVSKRIFHPPRVFSFHFRSHFFADLNF